MTIILTDNKGRRHTFRKCQDATVIEEDLVVDVGLRGELHYVFNTEGVVTDLYASREQPLDTLLATDSCMHQETVDRIYEPEPDNERCEVRTTTTE